MEKNFSKGYTYRGRFGFTDESVFSGAYLSLINNLFSRVVIYGCRPREVDRMRVIYICCAYM